MTKYNRITGKVFGGNANATGDNPEIGQFGSAKDGSYFGTSDISSIQSLPAWGKGWIGAVTPETNFPPLPEMTGAMKVFSEQQCYLLQQGIPEWDNATIYYKNSFSSQNGKIYISQSDENQGNDPETDTTNWKEFSQDKANKDLDNLTEAGEKHFLNKSQITNCLLEIPQRIKLELNNGTITLKAGSQVIVPNGFEADGTTPKFDYVVISEDKSQKTTYNANCLCFCNIDAELANHGGNTCFSGSTQPTSGQVWYNTASNKILVSSDEGQTWAERKYSLPIAVTVATTNGVTSIDQVFNGFGYIGSTVWVDKGVKCLIPNGRNADGSLNNIEFTTDKVLTYTTSFDYNVDNSFKFAYVNGVLSLTQGQTSYWFEGSLKNIPPKQFAHLLNTDNNDWYYCPNGDAWIIDSVKYSIYTGNCSLDTNGAITSFQPKQPFRAVDYNDFRSEVDGKVDLDAPQIQAPYIISTYRNGTSWYRVWSDGWCEQGGYTEFRYNTPVTLLKNYTNTNWSIQTTSSTDTGEAVSIQIISKTTSSFTPRPQRGTGNGANQNGYWYACGY